MPPSRLFALAVEAGAAAAIDPVLNLWGSQGGGAQVAYSAGAAVQHSRREWHVQASLALVHFPDVEALRAGLDAYRPDVVIASATGSPLEVEALEWSRRHGIGIVQIVDTWANLEGRFPGGIPDRIGVIDQFAWNQAIAAGFCADQLVIVGQPAWERLAPAPPAPPGSVLFVGQPVLKAWGHDLGYTEVDAFNICVEARRTSPEIARLTYLRHPAETAPFHAAAADSVSFDPKTAVNEHRVICGMFSSLSVEALLRGRQVITLLPVGATRRLCHLGEQGLTPVVSTAAELVSHVSSPPAAPDAVDLKASLARSAERTLAVVHSLIERSAA